LNSCFATTLTNLNENIVIGGVVNPSSLQSTSAFQVYTYGGIGMVDYLTSGPKVQMNTLAISSSFSVTPTSAVVHATTIYTFAITFYGTHTSGDYLSLTLPTGMSFSGTPTCTPLSGIASISCTVANSSLLQVTMVANPGSSVSFSVSNVVNYGVANTNVVFSMTIYNAAGYATEQTPNASLSYSPAAITASVVENNGIAIN
jgi:hypothetical protein